jgi:hypothetical protein
MPPSPAKFFLEKRFDFPLIFLDSLVRIKPFRRDPEICNDAAIFVTDDDDQSIAVSNILKASVDGLRRHGAKELHRTVRLLEESDRVEHPLSPIDEVAERAADEHGERRGHRVCP